MAVVRCPKHELPYNEDNPRGCPACAAEELGGTDGSASAAWTRSGTTDQPVELEGFGHAGAGAGSGSLVRSIEGQLNAATAWLTDPFRRIGRWIKGQAKARPGWATLAVVAGFIFVIVMIRRIGAPDFLAQADPPAASGEVLPLAVEPGTRLDIMFSILGTRTPRPHPTQANLERYVYSLDLVADAMNGEVYALTLRTPDRSWRGLRVGMSSIEGEGALSMLGRFTSRTQSRGEPQIKDGYQIFSSRTILPVRRITAEVRPPNGCLDVTVEFRPAITGVLIDGGLRTLVVAREAEELNWVLTQTYVVSRTGDRDPRNELICR
ncbi:MAG: hypothetical protein O7I93_08600 [Gemmatimonadetes bacterium]|nr:hypothetical protein [Gemmatimonadota bacterium]